MIAYRLLSVRSIWGSFMRKNGVDLTCGLIDALSELIGQPAPGGAWLTKASSPMVMKGSTLQEDYVQDLKRVSGLPLRIMSLDDRPSSALCGYCMKEEHLQWFCNEQWARMFMTQREAHHLSHTLGIGPWYFMSR